MNEIVTKTLEAGMMRDILNRSIERGFDLPSKSIYHFLLIIRNWLEEQDIQIWIKKETMGFFLNKYHFEIRNGGAPTYNYKSGYYATSRDALKIAINMVLLDEHKQFFKDGTKA